MAEASIAERTSGSRQVWMDVVRGTSVLLVILFHSVSYMADTGSAMPSEAIRINNAFAPFRIPALIFLSGILLSRSADKGVFDFAYGKFRNLLWPYVVWSIIFCLSAGKPEFIVDIDLWTGGSYLWYLAFLIFYFGIAIPLLPVPYLIIACYAVSLALLAPEGTKYGDRLLVLMAFFFCGGFVGTRLSDFTRFLTNRWLWAVVPIAIALTDASHYFGPIRYSARTFIVVALSVLALCKIAYTVKDHRVARPLAYVGRNSLIFYVVHLPVFVIVDRLCRERGVDPLLTAAISLPIAFGVIFLAIRLSKRFQLANALFAFPDLMMSKPEWKRAANRSLNAIFLRYKYSGN